MPPDGAIFDQPDLKLGWYTISGAVEYRVQIATEETFASPMIDETIAAPPLAASLAPGDYLWRVQAIAADGSLSDFSPASSLTVSAPGAHLETPARQRELDVPFFWQHKDTGMLLLESEQESGAHAWDVDHQILDMTDPADRGNCVLAAISMINAYFHNSRYVMLSQDRIGYEVFHERWIGPELDLSYDEGFAPEETARALTFAMGGPPTLRNEPKLEDFWAAVKTEIDAGRPILLGIPGHAVVVRGYAEEGGNRFVLINNPYTGQYREKIESLTIRRYWLMPANPVPAMDEATIIADTDGDGVVDFDERERFLTDPNNDDTDGDKVKDKQDIAAGVFDPDHGYAFHQNEAVGRDFDEDGWAMELDEDADGGGCFDGLEDFDRNGKRDQGETYNFEKGDDACIWGTEETYSDTVFHFDAGGWTRTVWRLYATFSLRALEGGKLEGFAHITYEMFGEDYEGDDFCGYSLFPFAIVPAVIRWSAELTGTYQGNPDGTTRVSFTATPDRSPPYNLVQEDWCHLGPITVPVDGRSWSTGVGQLKDGIYDAHFDWSLGPSETGEHWSTFHMEQSQGE